LWQFPSSFQIFVRKIDVRDFLLAPRRGFDCLNDFACVKVTLGKPWRPFMVIQKS
jgi:hypothetical protein